MIFDDSTSFPNPSRSPRPIWFLCLLQTETPTWVIVEPSATTGAFNRPMETSMSDNFRCELTFPRNALAQDGICDALQYDLNLSADEVVELRKGEAIGFEQVGPDCDQPELISACAAHARLGEMEATESALFEAGFPFNANAEGYLEMSRSFATGVPAWRPPRP